MLVTDPWQPLEVFSNHLAIRDATAPCGAAGADGSQKNAELTRYVVSLDRAGRKARQAQGHPQHAGESGSCQIGCQQQHFDLLDGRSWPMYGEHLQRSYRPDKFRTQVGNLLFPQQPGQHRCAPCCWRAFALWCCGAFSSAGSCTQIIFARKKMVELQTILTLTLSSEFTPWSCPR